MNYQEAANYCVENLQNNLSVFVGAGLSIDSGLPAWKDLVCPYAQELDIPMDGIPLERTLEYICGENKSKYSLLIYDLKKKIEKARPQRVHYLISKLNVDRVWTTNYDDLIEKAYRQNNCEFEVITNDFQLNNADISKMQLIKMHGSLSNISDDYEDIILLESQYENYENQRKGIYDLLKNDIRNKSFLFFGVSFNDINMRRIWSSIWNNKKCGHPSFLFTVPPKDEKELKIYKYWKRDLSRYGIEVVELVNYEEIVKFLNKVYVNKDGKTIVGLGTYCDDTYKDLCYEIGKLIAKNNYCFNSGGGKNFSEYIAKGMWDECPEIKEDLDRIVFFYRENGGSTNPQKGKIIYAGKDYTEMRKRLITPEKLCLLFGEDSEGRTGLKEEVSIARQKGCHILSIPYTGTISKKVYYEEREYWKSILDGNTFIFYEKLKDLDDDYTKSANNIIEIINKYFDK